MLRLYLTMLPLLLAGVANMLFTKTAFYRRHSTPIDGGRNAWDGKALLGKNKTWIGFGGMVLFCTLFQLFWGDLFRLLSLEQYHDLYRCRGNTWLLNVTFGFGMGVIYMLSELPNSFIKRRLDIPPGWTRGGLLGALFFIIDQIDSLVGVMLLLMLLTDIGFVGYLQYVAVGAVTHIGVNLVLWALKVRKNI